MEEAWYLEEAPAPDEDILVQARARQDSLTKPKGALGRLEEVVIQLAGNQRTLTPGITRPAIVVFAGDHGVAAEGVSAYPQAVTGEMVRNFSAGGAAITVLARNLNVPFRVFNMGTVDSLEDLPNVEDRRVAAGTQNICNSPAMDARQLQDCMTAGKEAVDSAGDIDLFIGGEMGIGNSTIAAALAVAHTKLAAKAMVGRGTGIDDQGFAKKSAVVTRALSKHLPHMRMGIDYLQRIGGFEVNALAAAYIRAAQKGIAVMVDGYICTAAAMAAVKVNPSIRPWLFFSHCSAEPGHEKLLNKLEAKPLLSLEMRLGEGSGAALALPILQSACALHREMASFDEAGVSRSV
ncbi:nicotinate-nucleotide--dimethylbenzimidazole phosphoribosyltransferase [Litorivivens sp.]|uniref:nicotinate-nucleotide--dimethylbenzimidazole phosphoribosyltransferase n=1 Tax=Litorivivens sp. TaxID=2020868 RepID=UPI0035634CE3